MDVSLLNIGAQAGFIIMTLCAGGTKFVDGIIPEKYVRLNGPAKILVSVLIGTAVSYGVDGISLYAGAAYGLATSGAITAIGYTKKTAPVEEAIEKG